MLERRRVTPENLPYKDQSRSVSVDPGVSESRIRLASFEKRTFPLNFIPRYKSETSRKSSPRPPEVPEFINDYMKDQNKLRKQIHSYIKHFRRPNLRIIPSPPPPRTKRDSEPRKTPVLRYRNYRHEEVSKKKIGGPILQKKMWKNSFFKEKRASERSETGPNYNLAKIKEPAMTLGEKLIRVKEYVIDPVCKIEKDLFPL